MRLSVLWDCRTRSCRHHQPLLHVHVNLLHNPCVHPSNPSPTQVVDAKQPGLKGLQTSVLAAGAVAALVPLARRVRESPYTGRSVGALICTKRVGMPCKETAAHPSPFRPSSLTL